MPPQPRAAPPAVLQASRRAHAEDGPHEEARVEPADMDEQPLQDVGVAPPVGATHPAGLVEMRVGPFQVLAAATLQPPVRVDRAALGIDPFELPDQQHPDIGARRQARATHAVRVERRALAFHERIEAMRVEHMFQPLVETDGRPAWAARSRQSTIPASGRGPCVAPSPCR